MVQRVGLYWCMDVSIAEIALCELANTHPVAGGVRHALPRVPVQHGDTYNRTPHAATGLCLLALMLLARPDPRHK